MLLLTAMYPQLYHFDDACDRFCPRTLRSDDAPLPTTTPIMSFRSIFAQNGGHIMTKGRNRSKELNDRSDRPPVQSSGYKSCALLLCAFVAPIPNIPDYV